jgi:hypothetical protein
VKHFDTRLRTNIRMWGFFRPFARRAQCPLSHEQCSLPDFFFAMLLSRVFSKNILLFAFAALTPASKHVRGANTFPGGKNMSRISINRSTNRAMTVFAALVLLVAIAARTAPAKDTKAGVSTTMSLLAPATFAGHELKPGDYAVSADDTHVQISMHGKVVAEAPVQWKDETSRAKYSAFVSENNKITEIHFGGKTRFVTIAE